MTPALVELINKLESEYPDKATLLSDMDIVERERYIAKLELIQHIKLLTKKDKR
jgi:hypothetical protein